MVDELMAEAPATAVDRVPVVKLDMRIIFHGAAVACSLSLTNVNAVLAAAPGLVASSQSGESRKRCVFPHPRGYILGKLNIQTSLFLIIETSTVP